MSEALRDIQKAFKTAAHRFGGSVLMAGIVALSPTNDAYARPTVKAEESVLSGSESGEVLVFAPPNTKTKRNFVLIAGPGGGDFDSSMALTIVSPALNSPATVYMVGNGEHDVDKKDITWALQQAKANKNPTTLCLLSHGIEKNGKHYICLDRGTDLHGVYTRTSLLFDQVKNDYGNTPLDVIVLSCHGGASVADLGKLPKGSTLAAVSGAGKNDVTDGAFVDTAWNHLLNIMKRSDGNTNPLTAMSWTFSYIGANGEEALHKQFKGSELEQLETVADKKDLINFLRANPSITRQGYETKDYKSAEKFLRTHRRRFLYSEILKASHAVEGLLTGENARAYQYTENQVRQSLNAYQSPHCSDADKQNAIMCAMAIMPDKALKGAKPSFPSNKDASALRRDQKILSNMQRIWQSKPTP